MNATDPEDRTVACAEYVLGTLDGAEREQFMALLAQDRNLQAEVGYWQDRLLGLAGRVPPSDPSDAVWQRIEAALRTADRLEAEPAPRPPSSLSPSPVIARAPEQRSLPQRFWERLGFWQTFSGFALAASLLLASLLVMRQPLAPAVNYVAVLQSPEMRVGWLVRAADRGPVRLVPLTDLGRVPAGKSWELWTKGRNATAPTSLGLVPGGSTLEVPRDRLPELGDEQLFEITLEPEAGSPTGRPTGPILFVGKAQRI